MRLSRFAKYAWVVLGYNIAVVLWGAFVRATGSGAGCGAHWPVCNGQVIPRSPSTETLIEFSHRLSSGMALVLVLALLIWALRAFGRGDWVRRGAAISMFFIITEALVGAGLVLFEWVAGDDSTARVYSMAVHLINTYLLLASLFLTAYWASGGARLRLREQGAVNWLVGVGVLLMLALGVSGAVIALGDTLALTIGLTPEESPLVAQLVSIRIYHPLFAVAVSAYWVIAARALAVLRPTNASERAAYAVLMLALIQLSAGVLNVWLSAPVWMQLIHLFLADMLWLAAVWASAAALAIAAPRAHITGWRQLFTVG